MDRNLWRGRFVALAPGRSYGVVVESEARQGDYVPPPLEDTTLAERVAQGSGYLQRLGAQKVYLGCIGPTFRETDLAALRNYFGNSPLAGVTLLSAAALRRMVEESICHRASFRLAEFAALLTGYNLLVDERAVETWFSRPEELRAARAGA